MNITYQVEKFKDCIEEGSLLGSANYKEGDPRAESVNINIDWELYTKLEDAGSMVLITARDEELLAGYLILTLASHPHIKDFIQASSDAIFVDKEYRGEGVGKELLTTAEEALKEVGVGWISLFFRDSKSSEGLMRSLNYKQTDVVFGKSLMGEG